VALATSHNPGSSQEKSESTFTFNSAKKTTTEVCPLTLGFLKEEIFNNYSPADISLELDEETLERPRERQPLDFQL